MSMELGERIRKALAGHKLARKIFALDGEIYIVGGFLRDIAAGRRSHDLDFVVGGRRIRHVVEAVHAISGGTIVELRKEHIIRIAHKDGRTIDFSRLDGKIEDDLLSRDFSVNAMAWSPKSGLLDPASGAQDIHKGIIRGILKQNFKNDPLRVLRTYRFSSQLGWHIESETRAWAKGMAKLLIEPASERLTQELFLLLTGQDWERGLNEAYEDNVLGRIIGLKSRQLGLNIKLVSRISARLDKSHLRNTFKYVIEPLGYEGLLRLEGLLSGADMSQTRLALSSDISRRVRLASGLCERFLRVESDDSISLYELFTKSGRVASDIIVLSGRLDLLQELKRFERIESSQLVSSEELMKHTGIGPSPRLGNLIREIKRLRFKGSIKSRRDALHWAGYHKKII